MSLQSLVERNPFAPSGHTSQASTPAEQSTLEFRGVVTDGAGTSYSIFDTSTNKGRWVRAEDTEGPVRVRAYDAGNGTLELEQNGRPLTLTLKRVVIQAGQPVAVAMPNPGAGGVVRGADGAADARRLEAVAAEVRRRRALRNAAQAQQGRPATGATGQVPTPPPASGANP